MSSWLKINFWSKNQKKKTDQQKSSLLQLEEEEFYGITYQLVEFIKSLTLDNFKTFSLPEEELDCEAQTTSGGVQVDLSDWQQQHAVLVLSKVKVTGKETTSHSTYFILLLVKDLHAIRVADAVGSFHCVKTDKHHAICAEIAHLRYLLCPRILKERDFWRIYFSLVNSYVIEYELQAIRLDKLKKMSLEDDCSKPSQTNGVELEMSGPKQPNSMLPLTNNNDDSTARDLT